MSSLKPKDSTFPREEQLDERLSAQSEAAQALQDAKLEADARQAALSLSRAEVQQLSRKLQDQQARQASASQSQTFHRGDSIQGQPCSPQNDTDHSQVYAMFWAVQIHRSCHGSALNTDGLMKMSMPFLHCRSTRQWCTGSDGFSAGALAMPGLPCDSRRTLHDAHQTSFGQGLGGQGTGSGFHNVGVCCWK